MFYSDPVTSIYPLLKIKSKVMGHSQKQINKSQSSPFQKKGPKIKKSQIILKAVIVSVIINSILYYILLMDNYSDQDGSLADSLAELDEDVPEESSDSEIESDNDGDNQNPDDLEGEDGKGNRRQKKQEQEEKKDYYAEFLNPDEDIEATPPYVVVVQGSKTSGKSSIIRSLIKHYTKNKVDQISGTITLRSNKKQRITIIECPNDITAMIDLSKIADIVLLTIDASLSFQMETFEFLSLLKCHGFPHVMGVLTHLDYFKDNKQLRKTRKKFKKRFQYEVGGNSKLFFLDKWEKGIYNTIEVAKIARYIGTSKPPTITWRNNHPYIVADRWQTFEDNLYKDDDQISVSFFGYVRGGSYRVNGKVHVVGLGDYKINDIQVIGDPCPEYKKDNDNEEEKKDKTKGDVMVGEQEEGDEEADDLKEKVDVGAEITKKRRKRRTLNQSQRIIYAPSCNLGTLNFDYSSGYVTIPHDYVKFTRIEGDDEDENVEEGIKMIRDLQDRKHSHPAGDRNDDFDFIEGVKIKEEKQEAQESIEKTFLKKQTQIRQLKRQTQALQIVNPYHDQYQKKTDLMHLIYESKQSIRIKDNSRFHPQGKFSDSLKQMFVTGMQQDILNENEEESDQQAKGKKQIQKIMNQNIVKASISQQTNFYKKGLYVKIVLENVNYKAFKKMKSDIPIILTRINLGEDNKGFIKVNFKRHRWYSNLLKSNDPIIVSSGWRRYQSLIVFSTEDQNQRMRFLKYTPQYDFCTGVFYGNFCLQNTGAIFLQTIRNELKKFRIAGSGLILEMNKSFDILKKIKLIGEPYKILKNTAFIKGMFNSSIEVSSYVGAQVRTVSGIRGQIKKSMKEGGEGTFRATFQDKISMSDLVFCKAWYKVFLDRFYNPILSFEKQHLMKTKYELKIQNNVEPEVNPDSQYKTIDRVPKTFMPFSVPKKLEARLPFKTVEKIKISKKEQIRRAESESIPKLLQGDKEREVASLIQRLNTIKHMKEKSQDQKFAEKQRLREARERPRQEHYEQLKKQQKSQKMASLMRKKKKDDRRKKASED